ncbi:MAG: hypothetical protein AABY18_06770 [Candidatus Thermoplasmatota archaeon]
MRQRLLTQLVQAPSDLDYVESFQALSRINLELRRHGPSADRLLRRANLERAVGNHAASLAAAQDALVLEPQNAEMHYQVGVANLFLALAKAEALPVGPRRTELPDESLSELLRRACDAFAKAAEMNPEDEDAREDVAVLTKVLDEARTESNLAEAMRIKTV